MNPMQSDGEGSVVETGNDQIIDATVEMEVKLRLSGPDTGCRYPALQNPIGSYRGPGRNQ